MIGPILIYMLPKKSHKQVTQDTQTGRRVYEFRQKETDEIIRKRKFKEQLQNLAEGTGGSDKMNTSYKSSPTPEKKSKTVKLTRELEKIEKSSPSTSPSKIARNTNNPGIKEGGPKPNNNNTNTRNTTAKKGNAFHLQHSKLKKCSSKSSKEKSETLPSKLSSGGKSDLSGSAITHKKSVNKSKKGNESKDRGSNDRTDFLKSVLL